MESLAGSHITLLGLFLASSSHVQPDSLAMPTMKPIRAVERISHRPASRSACSQHHKFSCSSRDSRLNSSAEREGGQGMASSTPAIWLGCCDTSKESIFLMPDLPASR